jgi:hypothetical protein
MRCKYCNRPYRYIYQFPDEIVLVCKQHLADCIESDSIAEGLEDH